MAIVPSGVSVPAQSKELDNNVVTTSYGAVYRQVVNLADPETPTNYQRVGSNGAYVDVRNVVSLPLPTGAATESTLSALSAKFSALGQTTMSASVPVVLASNHSDIVTKKSASSYAHLNSTGTTTIKSGAGILRRVVINTKGSASNTFTIYDNTSGSGTVIAAIDTVNGVSGHFEYNVAFSTGLTVVDATGTSADITVIYE
jgi:hypothetical protein